MVDNSEKPPLWISVEVAYAKGGDQQWLVPLKMAKAATVLQAIQASGIFGPYPEIHNFQGRVGIFGKQVTFEHPLQEGDRVEVYRPLVQDPKTLRRVKAEQNRAQRRRGSASTTR